jgi:CBS domain-containing membrane protein
MRLFEPLLAGAQLGERLVACVGALIGIAVTVLVCSVLPFASADLPVIVAPLGASAVLVFAVPASPLAQPWSVIGGNIISTLVGVTIYRLVPDTALAAGLAVGSAIAVMSLLRCLHPPGGAAALTAVIGPANIHAAGYGLVLFPIGINSLVLVLAGIAFHRATRRNYPHRPALAPTVRPTPIGTGLHPDDIDKALADMSESFDIAREDLELLLSRAEHHAQMRRNTP